ncbi:hypothetical protein SCA6_013479 [Theobroma cacao]
MEKSKSFSGYSEVRRGIEDRTKSYSFNGPVSRSKADVLATSGNPELKRRKRVASYNMYSMEGIIYTINRQDWKNVFKSKRVLGEELRTKKEKKERIGDSHTDGNSLVAAVQLHFKTNVKLILAFTVNLCICIHPLFDLNHIVVYFQAEILQ